jgi:xylulokinase
MSGGGGPVTVGVDIGTTSVKALAVDQEGQVVGRARVAHPVVAGGADQLEHDARRAWRRGPRRAYAQLVEALAAEGRSVAGVTVCSMVPSLTAVDRRGVPLTPGLLYGDGRGRPSPETPKADPGGFVMPDVEGFIRWHQEQAPDAAGFWPCQAVATRALGGSPAIDSGVTASLGALHTWGKWNTDLLEDLGVRMDQLPVVLPMAEAGGTLPGTDTVFTGGTIDAFCDQIVAGADRPGDVLAIFGATLVAWVVTDEWREAPPLMSVPHTTPDRFLVGGPSNAGALFVDWARRLLRGVPAAGPAAGAAPERPGDPWRVPIFLPYVRGERTPFDDYGLRASVRGLDIGHGPADVLRAAYEASGFVLRRLVELSGIEGRRIVASGGGTRVPAWMAAVADASGLPVETVGVPEGAARGAAFMARMAAGLEGSLDGSARWVVPGRRYEPEAAWAGPATARYEEFKAYGPGR